MNTTTRKPAMSDLCAVCGVRYGVHADMDDACPSGYFGFHKTNRFTPIAKQVQESAKPPTHVDVQFGQVSLRDWLAGQALAGLIACEGGMDDACLKSDAQRCYKMADAMLAAREGGAK